MAAGTGSDAARRRVSATLDTARRVELGRLIVGVPGPETEAARRRALEAAEVAGRSALVDEAREAALAFVAQAFAAQAYSGTWVVTEMAMSSTRAADRAAVAEALADAVTADAVEDVVDDETVEDLRATWFAVTTAGSIPEAGSLSGLTSAIASGEGRVRTSLVAALLFLIVGAVGFLSGNVLGIVFLVAGVFVLRNALRGRSA